jgi:hypothetical protein
MDDGDRRDCAWGVLFPRKKSEISEVFERRRRTGDKPDIRRVPAGG